MKNFFKLSGIIVLVAVIGFSFAACSNGSTDDPATYTAAIFWVSNSNYTSSFIGESVPTGFDILEGPGTKDGLIAQVNTAKDNVAPSNILNSGTGLSYAEVEGALQELVDAGITADKTALLNELNSKGYVVGVTLADGILVMAAYKE